MDQLLHLARARRALAALRAATEPVRARWEAALGQPAVAARLGEIVRTA